MARKLLSPSPDSSLSPVPESLLELHDSKVEAKTTTNGRKRKATTTETTITKRTKKTAAVDVKTEDNVKSVNESPLPKRGAAKKVKAQETAFKDETKVEDDAGETKVTKKKAPRAKKPVDSTPLASRTVDTDLLIGAHVSTAGG
jgi:AP endonuclease-1